MLCPLWQSDADQFTNVLLLCCSAPHFDIPPEVKKLNGHRESLRSIWLSLLEAKPLFELLPRGIEPKGAEHLYAVAQTDIAQTDRCTIIPHNSGL